MIKVDRIWIPFGIESINSDASAFMKNKLLKLLEDFLDSALRTLLDIRSIPINKRFGLLEAKDVSQ